ncbi:MAG: hypothetical protein J0H40_05510 [Rhizobiales bacterium]|nr:hypothetical protein [Hyphomicrobiales bacterium]
MIGIDRLMRSAAALALLLTFAPIPAKAQLGGSGDMMQQMAPMLEMMKAKMGKRRFAKLMQTMGPMMSGMMENGGLGGMIGGGGFGGFGAPGFGTPGTATPGFEGQGSGQGFDQGSVSGGPAGFSGFGAGGMGGFDAGQMMAMLPQLISLADMGGGSRHHHRKKRRHHRSAP